jgi:hypothetical protein
MCTNITTIMITITVTITITITNLLGTRKVNHLRVTAVR